MPMVGVSMKPGQTTLTRILRGISAPAMPRARAITAALAPEYVTSAEVPPTSATDEVNTTPPPSLMIGASFCTVKNAPLVLMSNARSYDSSVTSSNGSRAARPAL